jgi:hypothetical protein
MPLYYFHYRADGKLTRDTEGIELADEKEAVREAMLAAKEVIAHALLRGEPVIREAEFDIADSEGHHLYSFPFSVAADYPISAVV